ncbi:MAG TPA: cupredoxin domain-containing protein [Actinomycetota bacterium]|nr:cupredoxin domain-containing protein [Actinomycetota bacterium]
MPACKLTIVALTAAVALVAPACAVDVEDDDDDVIQEVELEAYDFYFEETSLPLQLGGDVIVDFVNAGDATHSFTVPDLDLEVEAQSGESTEVEFSLPDEPGVLDFFCKFHPDDMNGTISIGGAEAPLEEEGAVEDEDVDEDTAEDAPGGPGYNY